MDLVTLKKVLDGCESPFKWEIPDRDGSAEQFIKSQTEKAENISEETQFKWNNFIMNLLLAYEWCDKMRNTNKAKEYIVMCIKHLDAVADCKEKFFSSIKRSLWHVSLATYGQILLTAGYGDKIISKITPLDMMNSREKAGVFGIKAAVYLQYGTKGHRLALNAAESAKLLDPNQAEWHFIAGNAMGRIRRTENKKVSAAEVDCILQSVRLQRDASYVLHMATLCAEQSKDMFFDDSAGGDWKVLATKAVEYFKEAIAIRPNDALLKARVAHGLLRIRAKDSFDIRYVKQLLEEVAAALPNNAMVYHDLGQYYEKFDYNVNKAIWNLEKSNELGNEKALLSLISLKWRNNLRPAVIGDLKKGLDKYKGDESQAELFTYLGICYLLIENNWTLGLQYLSKSLKVDSSANYMKNFGGFKGGRVNILELIVDELRLKPARDNEPAFKPFLDLCKTIKPEIFKSTPILGFDRWKQDQLKARAYNNRR